MPEGVVHHPQLLTDVTNKLRNESYIADMVWPVVGVVKDTDRLAVYTTDSLKVVETVRANKSRAKEATFGVSYTTYYLQEHALSDLVTERDRANCDPAINADIDCVENLTDRLLLGREVAAATMAFTSSTWSTGVSLTSTTSWRYNTTTADPAISAHSATASIQMRSGKRPNQCVMGYQSYAYMRDNVALLDKIKYTQIGSMTPGLIAAIFDVDQLVIGEAVRDNGLEGVSSSNTSVWANGALFQYVERNPGLRKVSSGYLLTRTPGQAFGVKQWREEEYDGDRTEVSTSWAFKAVCTAAAYLVMGIDD